MKKLIPFLFLLLGCGDSSQPTSVSVNQTNNQNSQNGEASIDANCIFEQFGDLVCHFCPVDAEGVLINVLVPEQSDPECTRLFPEEAAAAVSSEPFTLRRGE